MIEQSMDTAPRDGTRISVNDGENWYVASWIVDYYIVFPRTEAAQEESKDWCIPESYQDEQGGYFTVDAVGWCSLPDISKE